MADEPVQDPQTQPDQDTGQRPGMWGVVAIVAVIVVLVLLFLLLRGCSAASSTGSAEKAPKEIVPVSGLVPVPGAVSVWVAQGTTVDVVLAAAGYSSAGVTDMGGGRFVLAVPVGTESAAVKKLKGVSSVYDAGLVFTDRASLENRTRPSTVASSSVTSASY